VYHLVVSSPPVKLLSASAFVQTLTMAPYLGAAAISSTGHQHHHHHHHHHSYGGGHKVPQAHTKSDERPVPNDPGAGPTRRHRKSPYPMLQVADALALIKQHTTVPTTMRMKVENVSSIIADRIVGHVLAEDVLASESVPAFRASIVDGYAIRIPKSGTFETGTYPVAFASHAQAGGVPELKEGEIARITTGAPLPPGSDAVIMVEDTVLVSKTDDGNEEKEVEILTSDIKAGENVREVGSDVKKGSTILQKGSRISAIGGEFGLLASVGIQEVSVYRKTIVGVLSTGDEIVPHTEVKELQLGEVRDTNRPTLLAAIQGSGFEAVDLGIAMDK
jgi:gephyrin